NICVALGLSSNWSFRSVSSPSERNVIAWFICTSCDCNTSYRRRFDFVSSVCTNPKRLSEGVLSPSSASAKLNILLPTMTSKLCFLSNQLRTYPPSRPTLKEPSGKGKRSQSLGLPSIKDRKSVVYGT